MSGQDKALWVSDSAYAQADINQQNQNNRVGENRFGYAALTQPKPVTSEWPSLPLSKVTLIIRGVTYKKNDSSDIQVDGYLPVLRANNIQNNRLIFDDLVYVPGYLISEQQKIKTGDIVVAMSSGSRNIVGKAASAIEDWSGGFGAFCGVLRPITSIDARYVKWFTVSSEYRNKVSELAAGVNINNLKPSHFDEILIPIPPLAEQHQIAAKLDELLAQVDSIKTRLDAIPNILKGFRQSVFNVMTSGELTSEWRKLNGHHEWEFSTLSTCGTVSGGLTKNAKRQSFDLVKPYLRVANVYANRLELSDVATIGLTKQEYAKTKLQLGDLLIVEGNGSLDQLGRVGIWSDELDDCMHQNHLIRWRSLGPLPKFVLYWLLSPKGRTDLMNLASTTTGLHTLSISKVGAIPINLPSMAEQTEIVRRVEQLLAYADQIEQRVKDAQARVNQLTQSILAKAFRGELTADWRAQNPELIGGENSAEALLERIRRGRAVKNPARKSQK